MKRGILFLVFLSVLSACAQDLTGRAFQTLDCGIQGRTDVRCPQFSQFDGKLVVQAQRVGADANAQISISRQQPDAEFQQFFMYKEGYARKKDGTWRSIPFVFSADLSPVTFFDNTDAHDDWYDITGNGAAATAALPLTDTEFFIDAVGTNVVVAYICACPVGADCRIQGIWICNSENAGVVGKGSWLAASFTLNLCGNSVVDDSENCDDGNTADGDGCSAQCAVEVAPATCVDGIQNQDETAADCGGVCAACPVLGCTNPSAVNFNAQATQDDGTCQLFVCGNEVVEGTEQCDDGNTVDFDSCTNACVAATCSDGAENQGEVGVDCGGSCAACVVPGCTNSVATNFNPAATQDDGSCQLPVCGDAVVSTTTELCDDGNTANGDGCTNCFIEDIMKLDFDNLPSTGATVDPGISVLSGAGVQGATAYRFSGGFTSQVAPVINLNTHAQSVNLGTYTIELWFKESGFISDAAIFYFGGSGTGGIRRAIIRTVAIPASGGKRTSQYAVFVGSTLAESVPSTLDTSKKIVNDGAWHQAVVTRDGSTRNLRFYIDGVEQGFKATSNSLIDVSRGVTTLDMLLGTEIKVASPLTTAHIYSTVGQLRIYSQVLTPEQISILYTVKK